MKQLKFMLAAATAIGIGSAMHAAQNIGASTGFEKLSIGTKVKYGVQDNTDAGFNGSYFWFDGANDLDNESEVVAFADNESPVTRPTGVSKFTGNDLSNRNNALQVSTGTDPLLRTFGGANNQGPTTVTFEKSMFVDTLVQFTVTPSGDTVTPAMDESQQYKDQLLVYLKESVNEQDQTVTTNLCATAGYMNDEGTVVAKEYTLVAGGTASAIEPNKWYRLTIEAIPNIVSQEDCYGYVGFRVKVDGVQYQTSDACADWDGENGTALGFWPMDETDAFGQEFAGGQILLSLRAGSAVEQTMSTLQAVGFAGEGMVDDIVITDLDPAVKTLNFTLTLGTGVSAVSYLVGTERYDQPTTVADVMVNQEITIDSVTYDTGYAFDSFTLTGLTKKADGDVFTVNSDATELAIVINAQATTPPAPATVDPTTSVTVNSQDAANALTISATPPEGVQMEASAYSAYFMKKIVDNNNGTFTVSAVLNPEVVKPDDVAADLATKFDEITDDGVTVAAKPGLYYSVEQGSDLNNLLEGDRVLATDSTVQLKATKYEGAGFYRVKINVTDKAQQ